MPHVSSERQWEGIPELRGWACAHPFLGKEILDVP